MCWELVPVLTAVMVRELPQLLPGVPVLGRS